MHTDPKQEAQMAEDAGLTGIPEEAVETPRVLTPSVPAHVLTPSVQTPPQGPVLKPTPAKQDKLDLERSAGEGMTAPPSNP